MRQECRELGLDGYKYYLYVVADVHESDVVILVSREILAAERKVQSWWRSITDETCASQPSDLYASKTARLFAAEMQKTTVTDVVELLIFRGRCSWKRSIARSCVAEAIARAAGELRRGLSR